MNTWRFHGALLATLLGATACGKDDSSNDKGDPATTAAAAELAGTWATGCVGEKSADDKVTAYGKTVVKFEGTSVTSTASTYAATDTGCATAETTTVTTSTFVGGAAVTSPANAKTFDATPKSVLATFISAEAVKTANDEKFCGFNDWAANVAKDITKVKCDEEEDTTTSLSTFYDIYAIVDGKLLFGDSDVEENDELGTAATQRPTTLDSESPFTKQ